MAARTAWAGRTRARPARSGLTAHAAVAAEADAAGRTRITTLRSDGPLALRETPEAVYLIGAAAGPLGGDDLRLDIEVGPRARLVLRSAASAVLLPGVTGEPSRLSVHAHVGRGGHLDYALMPAVAAARCDHRAGAVIDLAADSSLRWREEVVLGRHREPSGRHRSRMDITMAGAPLYRGELAVGDPVTDASSAVLGGARAAGCVVLTSPGHRQQPQAAGECLSVLPLAGPGVIVSATAPDAALLRVRLSRGEMIAGYGPSQRLTAAQ